MKGPIFSIQEKTSINVSASQTALSVIFIEENPPNPVKFDCQFTSRFTQDCHFLL